MMEEPIHAVITARFDLGFIVEHSNGQFGQLRVPEMSASTAELDRSTEEQAGIGREIEVYLIHEMDGRYFFSEFSSEERSTRDQRRKDWIKAQRLAVTGQALNVLIERKNDWGCVGRQETEPFLEGMFVALETVNQHKLPMKCATSLSDWDLLIEGAVVSAVIIHKEWAHWRHMLYFSLADAQNLTGTT